MQQCHAIYRYEFHRKKKVWPSGTAEWLASDKIGRIQNSDFNGQQCNPLPMTQNRDIAYILDASPPYATSYKHSYSRRVTLRLRMIEFN